MCNLPVFTEVNDTEFALLKADIEAYSRLCGYYVICLFSIRDFRVEGLSQEAILEGLIHYFDDSSMQLDALGATHNWMDCEVPPDRANAHVIESLVGGR